MRPFELVRPPELDPVGRASRDLQLPFVVHPVMAIAERDQVPQLVTATGGLRLDVVHLEAPGAPASGNRAAMTIALEDLRAPLVGDRLHLPPRVLVIDRAQVLAVAQHPLDLRR